MADLIESSNPFRYLATWHVVKLGGRALPGISEIDAADLQYAWDKKTGKGANGSTSTITGRAATSFKIHCKIYTVQQGDDWSLIDDLIFVRSTKAPALAYSIDHPSLAGLNITSVSTESIGAWRHLGSGVFGRTIGVLEYAPPPPVSAVSTPSGTAIDSGVAAIGAFLGVSPNPELTAAQQANAEAAAQLDAALKGGPG